MHILTREGRYLVVVVSAWVFVILIATIYSFYIFALSTRMSNRLLSYVRQESPEVFERLHLGAFNSHLGIVPFVTLNSSRFNDFVMGEELNEVEVVCQAKAEFLQVRKLLLRAMKIWLSAIAILVVLILVSGFLIHSGLQIDQLTKETIN